MVLPAVMSVAVRTVEVTLVWRRGLVGRGFEMGGFEVRPVTAADLDALLSGRCTCGCEDGSDDDGQAEDLEPVLREYPIGSPPWVEALDLDFAANMDGRWAPTWQAFETQLRRLVPLEEELEQAAGLPGAMPDRAEFTLGVYVAKEWTLGVRPESPLIKYSPMPVCNATVRMVMEEAEDRIRTSAETPWYAVGALAWLRWITGQTSEIEFPAA